MVCAEMRLHVGPIYDVSFSCYVEMCNRIGIVTYSLKSAFKCCEKSTLMTSFNMSSFLSSARNRQACQFHV